MSKLLGEFLWKLLVFSAACVLFHYFLEYSLPGHPKSYFSIWETYTFLALLTLIGYIMVLYIHLRDAEKTGMAFIAIGLFKMLAAVLFLYPLISSESDNILAQVLIFFIPYFLYLGFDTYFTIRLLSKNKNSNPS